MSNDPVRDALLALVDERVSLALSKLTRPANDELLTTVEAAQIAKVTPATVRRWVRDRRLQRHGPGQVRVRREDLERLIATGRSDAKMTPQERARKRVG